MDPLRASNKLRRLIRAYHGSPHSFSRFDASKIGTGEGAQAFGHGLYFAGNEEVADGYRAALAGKYPPILIGDQPVEEAIAALPGIDDRLRSRYIARELPRVASRVYGMTDLDDSLIRQATLFRMREAAEEGGMPFLGPEHLDALLLGRGMRLGKRPGHMYEVEIDYPEEALLDHDSPFMTPAGSVAAGVLRAHNPAAISPRTLREIQSGEWRFISPSPQYGSPYQRAASELHGLARTPGGSAALAEAGIPGIRYLDQGSRSSGEGTRNYVMFPGTEDRIRILRKYGLLPPLAGAGAMGGEE